MKHSEFDITCAKWGDVQKIEKYDMAILPWGATEPHNGHLPYCTDVLASQAIALDVAAAVKERGLEVMVLPGVPFGSQNPGQRELPFCIHTSQATQAAILHDIVCSLEHQGIKGCLSSTAMAGTRSRASSATLPSRSRISLSLPATGSRSSPARITSMR